jgi:hypothetical protein
MVATGMLWYPGLAVLEDRATLGGGVGGVDRGQKGNQNRGGQREPPRRLRAVGPRPFGIGTKAINPTPFLGHLVCDQSLLEGPISPLIRPRDSRKDRFWNARSDQYRSKVFMGLSPRSDSVALGVVREGYGWSIQGGQIEVAIQDHEYAGSWLGIPSNQFYPVQPRENEGGPAPHDNVAHDFRVVLGPTNTRLQYKEIYSSAWLSPDWSLFGGPPPSDGQHQLWVGVGGRVGDPDQIDHTDFLIDRIQLTATDYNCQDGGPCPSRTEPFDDGSVGSAGGTIDPCLWNTRDSDSGAGVVDVGGDALRDTNGRGTVQLDGGGQVWLEGDMASPAQFGQLGMVSVKAVRRPLAGEMPVYVYFGNARAERYRSKIILGLSYRFHSVSVGEIRQGYGWSILGGAVEVAVQDTEYDGGDLGIADEFYPVAPLENEGGPDPAGNIAHDFRIKVTPTETQLEYKKVSSRLWQAPDWSGVGGAPPSGDVKTMWVAVGAKVGPAADIDHTDFLIDGIQVSPEDLNCQGGFCCVRPDFDCDGDVDLADFGVFQGCFNGPNRPYAQPIACQPCDLDGDNDVDLADFGVFQGCFNGPNRPPACN